MAYRIVSLVFSSIIYSSYNLKITNSKKLLIILGMIVACAIILFLYYEKNASNNSFSIIILIEIIWNCFFLIISGGFLSPYIWYTISSIILVAIVMSKTCTILIICFNVLMGNIGLILYHSDIFHISTIIIEVGYVLLTTAIILLVYYEVQSDLDRKKLGILLMQIDSKIVMSELIDDICNVISTKECMWIRMNSIKEIKDGYSHEIDQKTEEMLLNLIKQKDWRIDDNLSYEVIYVLDKTYIANYFIYNGINEGVFLYRYLKGNLKKTQKKISSYIQLMSSMLTRIDKEDVEEKLIISEEQNRIANEIHDTVLQKLFAISCKTFVLEDEIKKDEQFDIVTELGIIRKSIDSTMKELRDAIYGYDWMRKGRDVFLLKLKQFIDDIISLYKISIDISVEGDLEKINVKQKTALYRIICEGVNNAIRHGDSQNIVIEINVDNQKAFVQLKDDGKGFILNQHTNIKQGEGLGLRNIKSLVNMIKGELNIKTELNKGTTILVEFFI